MVAIMTQTLTVIAGKDFDEFFELADDRAGPLQSLDEWPAWEIRLSRTAPGPAMALIWSTASGHLTVSQDRVLLHVPAVQTETMGLDQPHVWSWLLSYGADPDAVPEKPFLSGTLLVRKEP